MSSAEETAEPAQAPAPAPSSSGTIEERWDEQYQQTYYLDTVTGESGWTREEVELKVDANAAGSRVEHDGAADDTREQEQQRPRDPDAERALRVAPPPELRTGAVPLPRVILRRQCDRDPCLMLQGILFQPFVVENLKPCFIVVHRRPRRLRG